MCVCRLILHAMGCAWYFVGSEDANGWVFRSGVDSGPLAHRYATTLGCKGNIVLFRFRLDICYVSMTIEPPSFSMCRPQYF